MRMTFEKNKRKNPPGGENSGRSKKEGHQRENLKKKKKIAAADKHQQPDITKSSGQMLEALILVPDSLTEGVVSCERTQIAVP